MKVFDKQVNLRDYVCSPTGGYSCPNNMVNLYIYASNFCPAHCSFCPGYTSKQKIDFNKLKIALIELHNKQVINRISITGGEPLSDLNSLDRVLKTIIDVCGTNTYHISVNTNGINLAELRNIDYFSALNDIHISRHSICDSENDKIFRIKTPTVLQILKEVNLGPNIFSLSCNLLRGHIDSNIKLKEYLDMAISIGVYQVGFVSLFNKTKSCSDLFIDYEEITSKLYTRDGFLFETMLRDKNLCKCENFVYYNKDEKIPFYLRRILDNNSNCVKAFIFSQNNLTTNFNKGTILL